MSETTHRCPCGATLRYRQDMHREDGLSTPSWRCGDCLHPVPTIVAEKISHQHPS